MSEVLLEIGCEELPVEYIDVISLLALKTNAESILHNERLKFEDLRIEATPRRIAFFIHNLHPLQADEEKVGPPRQVLFDVQGHLTKQGEGFLRKWELKQNELVYIGDQQNVQIRIPGKPVQDVLPKVFLNLFKAFQFPKTMRWEASGTRFARPVRWLVALLDHEVIPFQFADVVSGRLTQLHPLQQPKQALVENICEYPNLLKCGNVELYIADRERELKASLQTHAKNVGGQWVEDTDLLHKAVMMAEWPSVVTGKINAQFMTMPREIITTAMREHQRYFAVEDASGRLLPYFLAVYDNPKAKPEAIRPGCERVLEARLKDARFFYQEDLKVPLPERVPQLERVLWIKGLGNLLDKTRRLERLTGWLAEKLEPEAKTMAQQAAHIAKADLITNMIQEKEYNALQGFMGGVYAQVQGLSTGIAKACQEQYLPRGAKDTLPKTPAGRMLALADKLDHLIGCWGAGFAPTGVKDPYALRRAAQGILAVTLDAGYHFAWEEVVQFCWGGFGDFLKETESAVKEIKEFIQGRLETELSNRGMGPDLIQAVLGVWWDDITAVVQKAEAIHALRKQEGFNEKIITFSRVVNILPKDTPRQIPLKGSELTVDDSLFTDEAERVLYAEYQQTGRRVAEFSIQGKYQDSFDHLTHLKPYIDRFFTEVMVMDKDERLRRNRLNLLENLARTIWSLADFSRLVVTETT